MHIKEVLFQMTASEKFGRELRRIRTERGWSQDYLAKLLNTTKQVISNYETCKRSPNIYTAAEYAKLLNVKLEDMVDVSPAESQDADRLEALHQDPKLCLLFDRTRKMKPEDVDTMLAVSASILRELEGE